MDSKRLPALPTMKPSLRYYGQHAFLLPLADFVHQAVPVALGRAWAAVSQNAKLGRDLARARRMQQSCNQVFAHFASHTYDFQSSSQETLDAEFEADEYLERIFRGAARFLLKLDVSLQTVATEKLYRESEIGSECENTSSGSGSSNSGGDDDDDDDDDDDASSADSQSEAGRSPASSILNASGSISEDAVKAEETGEE
ncbi:hypothetical protein PG988_004405 [Apiospora saccharicola]